MKGIMFNTKYGLEQAVLNGTKTRTWRADQKPRYEVGEIVAIKQKYSDLNKKWRVAIGIINSDYNIRPENKAGWNNKMFVKNELMPHQIKITKVTPCKLQDITEEECLNEGVNYIELFDDDLREEFYYNGECLGLLSDKQKNFKTPKEAFADLINKLNGKGYWESNPDGYAYEFELVK